MAIRGAITLNNPTIPKMANPIKTIVNTTPIRAQINTESWKLRASFALALTMGSPEMKKIAKGIPIETPVALKKQAPWQRADRTLRVSVS